MTKDAEHGILFFVRPLVLFLLVAVTAFSNAQTPSVEVPKMAILQPILGSANVNERGESISPYETASRVIPKLANEAPNKLKWPVSIVEYKTVVDAEDAMLGNSAGGVKTLKFRQYKTLAEQLGARYIVTYTVREHTGHYAGRGLLSGARTTGRTSIELTVYDHEADEFVWQDSVIDTSTAPGKNGMGGRIDQSMFNALRKAIEPFLLKGERKKVARPTVSYVATVKQVVSDGKRVLLDLGADSDIAVGDVLIDLDGNISVKVTEVLKNGSIAEVVKGTATAGALLKSSG